MALTIIKRHAANSGGIYWSKVQGEVYLFQHGHSITFDTCANIHPEALTTPHPCITACWDCSEHPGLHL